MKVECRRCSSVSSSRDVQRRASQSMTGQLRTTVRKQPESLLREVMQKDPGGDGDIQ